MNRGLIFYERSTDQMEFYAANGGGLALLGQAPASGRTWTHFVAGNFFNANFSGLLVYESSSGSGIFAMPMRTDRFSPGFRTVHSGWRTSWTQILAGYFGGIGSRTAPADLLFYDPAAGTGEFYRTKEVVAQGELRIELVLLRTHTTWRPSWTQIVPGHFGGDGVTDLLFYEAATGLGEFYSVNAQGQIKLLKQHTNWRTSWRQIVPGNFGGSGFTDLLFYDPHSGTGEFYATDNGRLQLLRTHTGWRPTWAAIVPGDFASNGRTSLMFYDATAGHVAFYATDQGAITLMNHHEHVRKTWTNITAFDSEPRGGGEL
jgi:hypothetical protein